MTSAEKYVTAAYLVVLAVVLLYIVLYAFKLARLGRDLEELSGLAAGRSPETDGERAVAARPDRDPSARLTRQ